MYGTDLGNSNGSYYVIKDNLLYDNCGTCTTLYGLGGVNTVQMMPPSEPVNPTQNKFYEGLCMFYQRLNVYKFESVLNRYRGAIYNWKEIYQELKKEFRCK